MKIKRFIFVVLECMVILLMSLVATYGFQHIETMIQDQISGFRNITYLMIIILSFSSLYHRNKHVAFIFSFILSTLLLLLTVHRGIWESSLTLFFLATMLGVLSVVLIPEARGREFALFLMILIFPLLLAESRLLSSVTVQENWAPFYQIYTMGLTIVGGYFYLRYATWIKLTERELLLRGGGRQELTTISWRSSLFAVAIVASAMGVNTILAESVVTIANHIGYHLGGSLIFLLIFAGIVAVAIVMSVYVLAEKSVTW
jgi:hypothetical protein